MLSVAEGRVLGSLLEKQRTTPDYYPLTLNTLVSACNQSSSRDPVMALSDNDCERVIASLKAAGLVRMVHPSHGKSVTRFRQVLDERLELDDAACSVLAVLLLRGRQTLAEIRTRTERAHPFESLEAVESCLNGLAAAGHAHLLDQASGRRDARWQQLIAEEPDGSHGAGGETLPARSELMARIAELDAHVATLEIRVAELEATSTDPQ